MIGVDPLVDFACKKLLGSPEHPAITMHFLNAVLRGAPPITEVEILNPIVEKEFQGDKYSILDIRARDLYGRRFNIEIQRSRPAAIRERLTYYAATQLVEQLGAGAGYDSLQPAIGICILDAIIFANVDDLHLDFRQTNGKHGLVLTDHLQIHLLELPKYKRPRNNRVIADPIEQWCYFFAAANQSTAEELVRRLPDPVFSEATGVLEMIARDPEQRSLYEARLKVERDARAKCDYAMQQGMHEGMQQGRLEGRAIGKVMVLRDLLQETSPTDDELLGYSMDRLTELEADFRRRLQDAR